MHLPSKSLTAEREFNPRLSERSGDKRRVETFVMLRIAYSSVSSDFLKSNLSIHQID